MNGLLPSRADAASFEAQVDDLYASPLDEFVAARKRGAAELKREGAAAEARSFGGLSKPMLSAWITNQTVRQAPELVAQLLEATDAVAAAQRKQPAAHGRPPDFAAAVAAQRKIVAQLAGQARAVVAKLGPAGTGAGVLERVENNFRWGAIAGADREALARGRLIRDVAAPGFAGFGDAVAADETRPAPAPTATPDSKADARRAEAARDQARATAEAGRERRRAAAQRQAALRDAQGETASARRDLARAERALVVADQRVAGAEAALTSAREARDAAEKHRFEAAEELRSREGTEATLRG